MWPYISDREIITQQICIATSINHSIFPKIYYRTVMYNDEGGKRPKRRANTSEIKVRSGQEKLERMAYYQTRGKRISVNEIVNIKSLVRMRKPTL